MGPENEMATTPTASSASVMAAGSWRSSGTGRTVPAGPLWDPAGVSQGTDARAGTDGSAGGAAQAAVQAALLAEAAAKSGLLWIRPEGQDRSWPAWHVWHDGAVVVVSGPDEQELPELTGPVELLLRSKDTGQRLLRVPAVAAVLAEDDDRWEPAARALAASRLNATTSPARLPERWRGRNPITELRAAGAALEAPGNYDDGSGAAPPQPTPATTSGWRPWHLRGRRRRLPRRGRAR